MGVSSIHFSERAHGDTLVNGVFSYPSLSNGVGRCVVGGTWKIFVLDN